jgi:hypothetical protein
MRNLRRRIERLEARQPADIILTLRDGSCFYPRGPALNFYMEALADINEERSTPLSRAVLDTVSAEGCGSLWRVLQALASPQVEMEGNSATESETQE